MRPDLSKITSSSVRTFLREHPYRRYGHVPYDVEYLYLETVPQADVFFMLCEELLRPPTQEEYIKRYLELCKSEISEKGVNPEYVGNRVARAWATYISELDFYCQVRDSGLFEQVIYDTKFNVELGYDLVITYKGRTFYVHTYFYYKEKEKEARGWLDVKERRKLEARTHLDLPPPLELPLTDEDADFIGNVHLYKASHIQKLKQMLEASL